MRIIGGQFRGRRLASLGKGDKSAHLRPTSDRVRESLFSILTSYNAPAGMRVLDLFAGSGALGLEALSRGADSVSFVENGRAALALLRDNIARCRAEGATTVMARDARKLGSGPAHDLVFLDPPYAKGMGEKAVSAALTGGWLAPGALVVWEESEPVHAPAALRQLDERKYGDTYLRIFELSLSR